MSINEKFLLSLKRYFTKEESFGDIFSSVRSKVLSYLLFFNQYKFLTQFFAISLSQMEKSFWKRFQIESNVYLKTNIPAINTMNVQIVKMKINFQSGLVTQSSSSNPQRGSARGGPPPIQLIACSNLSVWKKR